MMGDYAREQKGKCKTLRAACGLGTKAFLASIFFQFFLLNFSNVEKRWGVVTTRRGGDVSL